MGLRDYRAKRNFDRTAEPRGADRPASARSDALSFVVQKHAARRLHYDFRLELDGALKSWAVPKGPSLDPKVRRLAMHVEDHPLEYGDFEGSIPANEYGAGNVIVWDRGTWRPIGDADAGYRKGHLDFELFGEKLHGSWALVRIKGKDDGKQEPWLLIKRSDAFAAQGEAADLTVTRPESVKSGRLVEDAETAAAATWHSSRGAGPSAEPGMAKKTTAKRATTARASRTAAATHPPASVAKVAKARGRDDAPIARLPERLEPQLATLSSEPPTGPGWVYEIKFDGYRILAREQQGRVRLFSRNDNDWTSRMADVADAVGKLSTRGSWLDGEVVVLDDKGRSSFQLLQNAFRGGAGRSRPRFVYCVFDAPFLDGRDLRALPLTERKARLAQLLEGVSSPQLAFSGSAAGDGEALLAQACRNGLEGLIAKRADGRYESARSRAWLKLKCTQRQEFVVGGYTDPAGSREGFGALLLGVHDPDGSLRYVGKVGTGFDSERLDTLAKRLKALEQKTAPFANPPRGYEAKGAHWLKPQLVAEVSFSQWTDEGLLRQAVFQGLRDDKKASEITVEQAVSPPSVAAKPKAVGSLFAGIRVTHPDRVIYPEVGVTKAELAAYYDAAAAQILPHLAGRPLSLVRCPEGAGKQCFFQKHALNGVVGVDTIDIRESDGVEPYMIVNSAQALISLVQMGTIELHTWGSSAPQIERPDRMIFDLDPDEGLDWSLVVDAARLLKTVLDELGLKSFLKTTGGKGLHIVVPLARRHDWDAVKGFSGAVAEHIAGVIPERFTANMSKARRKGRIFIDFHRNDRGATAIAAWSARARANATVSVPIAWDELDAKLTSSHFNVRNIGTRLAQKQDPWAGYWSLRQNLTADMRRALARAARR